MKNEEYFVCFLLFFFLELLYIRFAKANKILDRPSERGLSSNITVRGGGIVFWFAGLFYFIYSELSFSLFFLGFTFLVVINFFDDKYGLSSRVRFLAQFFAIIFLFLDLPSLAYLPIYFILLFFYIGILNVFNFMDGVNGLTGLYSGITLLTLFFINTNKVVFVDNQLLILVLLSVFVFLIFNFRKNAICFCGDLGSVGIAFIILFVLSLLIFRTENIKYFFILFVYGLDGIYTILYRISKGENVFEPHKLHLYQILVYKFKLNHLQVSIIYCLLQLIINFVVMNFEIKDYFFYIPLVIVGVLYHLARVRSDFSISIK